MGFGQFYLRPHKVTPLNSSTTHNDISSGVGNIGIPTIKMLGAKHWRERKILDVVTNAEFVSPDTAGSLSRLCSPLLGRAPSKLKSFWANIECI